MTEHQLHVSIVTPQATAYEGPALAVSVPGSQSPFQVLYNHAPIISSLDIGVLRIEDPNNKMMVFASREGFVEVLRNNVNIVVDELVAAQTIDESQAATDVATAREEWNQATDRTGRAKALNELHWAEARERAARLLREQH
jgi:F-type H+-transporting ATPase subunit epsilon